MTISTTGIHADRKAFASFEKARTWGGDHIKGFHAWRVVEEPGNWFYIWLCRHRDGTELYLSKDN